mmetsp:Transcript_96595/g.275674  ORF Transcript_96595/g.275674 Transcript_96595/m.275674 type:complete len:114 (+) Transcript_96595:95-436(+)
MKPHHETSADAERRRYKESVYNTAVCVGAAIIFGIGVAVFKGRQSGFEFFAGYLVEQSLSVDNLFVFLMLFNYFKVRNRLPHAAAISQFLVQETFLTNRPHPPRCRSSTRGEC